MLPPLIQRPRRRAAYRRRERGVTLALVALAIFSIVAMAGLSIDVGTLYQAKAEAQTAADAAALTAARMISISGVTGDPTNGASDGSWGDVCGGTSSPATLAAINVAQQNLISGIAVPTANVLVNYGGGSGGASSPNCGSLGGTSFGVNPVVAVTVTSARLPIFFARVFSLLPNGNFANATASATATAEVFNSSNSGTVVSSLIPVAPRCVKPLIVPNIDPTNGGAFIRITDGSIVNPGVLPLGRGVIGESFTLTADCQHGQPNCEVGQHMIANPPQSNYPTLPPTLQYIPALISGTPGAVPSCATGSLSNDSDYQPAIGGCDQSTVYACGTQLGAQADLTENPVNPHSLNGDTGTALQCLIHAAAQGAGNGQDQLNTATYPFQIQAGSDNPLVKDGLVSNNGIITTSSSIVTMPIYDNGLGAQLARVPQPPVTIVGFLQLFIQYLDGNGHPYVTVLNVAGCGNGQTTTVSSSPVFGTSPVPVRLITPP